MLAGVKPFYGEHKAAMTYAIVNEEPVSISNHLAEVPEGVEQILRRCLAKDPEDRYETAGDLLADLGNLKATTEHGNEQTTEETIPLGIGKKWNSTKWMVGASVIVIVVIVLLFAWWFFGGNSSKKASENLSIGNGKEAVEKSVAVLPFDDFSAEGDQQWFSDGLSEEILISLSRLRELQVVARTSSFLFRDTELPAREIADSLNVNFLVEGSVRRSQDKIRIAAQLIRAQDGSHIWSDTYDRHVDSVFKVQEDIAGEIASSLDIYMDEQKREQMFSFGTHNVKAFEDFLKGKSLFRKGHKQLNYDLLWTANDWFEKAIRHDSKFAAPHFYHHDVYVHYLVDGIPYPGEDSLGLQEAYEQLQQDLTSASKFTQDPGTRVIYKLNQVFLSNDWTQLPELARQLKTNRPTRQAYMRLEGLGWSWHFLNAGGYASLVHPLYLQIIERNPMSFLPIYFDGETLANMGKTDSAIIRFNQLMQMNKEQSISKTLSDSKFYTYLFQGNTKKAKSILPDDSSLVTKVKEMFIANSEPTNDKIQTLLGRELPDYVNYELVYKIYINFAANKMETANEIAGKIDAKILGPQKLSIIASLNSGVMLFDLQSTPRLAERFEEAGIEVKPIDIAGKQAYRIVQKEVQ